MKEKTVERVELLRNWWRQSVVQQSGFTAYTDGHGDDNEEEDEEDDDDDKEEEEDYYLYLEGASDSYC